MPQALRRGKRRAPALRLGARRRPCKHPAGAPLRRRTTSVSRAPSRAPPQARLAYPSASTSHRPASQEQTHLHLEGALTSLSIDAPRLPFRKHTAPPAKGLPIPKDRRLYIALRKIGQIMRIWTPFWQICPIWTLFWGHFRDFCVHIAFIWPVFLRTESPPSAPTPLRYRAPSPTERLRVAPLPSTLSTHPRALLRRFATERLRPPLGASSPTHFRAPPDLSTPSASLLR